MITAKKSKILAASRSVFLRYGYKRVNMNDIAAAAGVSRPALYLLFKNKEQIFISVYLQWIEETIVAVNAAMAEVPAPTEKIARAFEIWAVTPFEMTAASTEARELVDCAFGFAQDALAEGYAAFEAAITPALAGFATGGRLAPDRIAHILTSAVRGFKQTADTPDALRRLIGELLLLVFGAE